jgi:hypothetical protein
MKSSGSHAHLHANKAELACDADEKTSPHEGVAENERTMSYYEAKQAASDYQLAKALLVGQGRVFETWAKSPRCVDDFQVSPIHTLTS